MRYKGDQAKKEETVGLRTPEGSEEELLEAFNESSEYLYKLLDFAEKEEELSEEEIRLEKRLFRFLKYGPRAGHFRHGNCTSGKLTSAEVLYMLTSTYSSEQLAKKFNITQEVVSQIRRGVKASWRWEYLFVKRIRAILKTKMRKLRKKRDDKAIYSLSKIHPDLSKEILLYAVHPRTLKKLRVDIIPPKVYEDLVKNNTLEVMYPIDALNLII